ncbi:MAK10-like protein [Tanacetum coccineum]
MGDVNPIRILGYYSKPSHEGYRNTIELPIGNNVVPLRSDIIRMVQNGCSFHRLQERTRLSLFQFSLRDQGSNWLERLQVGSITTWEDLTTHFLAQFFLPGRTAKLRNDILMSNNIKENLAQKRGLCEIDCATGRKIHNKNPDESWEIIENIALYDHDGWNDAKEFVKPVKAISTP